MCDTLVALPSATADKTMLFGKNSDRVPDEPHIMVQIPAKKHEAGEPLQCTYIQIEQVARTYALMLFKPSWLWGAEMGINERGVAIGNEAVFTKLVSKKPALLGMDLLRLALERADTAYKAKEVICSLLEKYGQGGNGAYGKATLYYDNSFLIADKNEAWILETAGRFWAAKRVKSVAAISNCLTIQSNYDEIHPQAIQYALERRYCKEAEDFGFASCFTEPVFTHFSKGRQRLAQSLSALKDNEGAITQHTIRGILRSHPERLERGEPLAKNGMDSVCMHAGGIISDHTTGSMTASIGDEIKVMATGASTPCFSVYKPLWFSKKSPLFTEEQTEEAVLYWFAREKIFREALMGHIDLQKYREAQGRVQAVIDSLVGSREEIMKDAFNAENLFVETALERFGTRARPLGGPRYRAYWRRHRKEIG